MNDARDQVRDRLREVVQVLYEALEAAQGLNDRLLVMRLVTTLRSVYACQERAAELDLTASRDQRVTE